MTTSTSTAQERANRLLHHSDSCPYCGELLEFVSYKDRSYQLCVEDGYVELKMKCTYCNAQWTETYTLALLTFHEGGDEEIPVVEGKAIR